MKKFVFFFSAFFLFTISEINAQFFYKMSCEAGLFKNSISEFIERNDLLTRLEGQVKYLDEQEDKNISSEIRAQPEIFGFKNQLKTLRLRAKGDFYKFEDNFNWGINLTAYKHFYKGDQINIDYENLILNGYFSFNIIKNTPFYIIPGYAYQKINSNGIRNMNLIFLEANMENTIQKFVKIGYGIYCEKFSIENKAEHSATIQKNIGWRIGPLVNLKYIKDFVFNSEYRFMLHYSDVTNKHSFEQSLRLIFGKIILPSWSAFILVDFYFRKYLLKEDIEVINGLIYSQMDSENRYYFKTAYELWDDFELYTKFGYSKENLDYIKYTLAGWSITAGAEINF